MSSNSPSRVASSIAARHRQVSLVPANEEQEEAQDHKGHAEVHAVSRPLGRPSQTWSANDQYGREEQKEEPFFKVNSHSSTPVSSSVNFLPLIQSLPMCGPSSMAGGMYLFNPAAPEFYPRPPGVPYWVPASQQPSMLQAIWPSSTWLGHENFLGVGPWPWTPQFGPCFGLAPL